MPSFLALREIEKKMWLRTFEHGLWDIGIGSLFLMFGLTIVVHFPALAAIWIVGLMPGLREVGRKLVVPRIGHVQFREPRSKAKDRLTGVLTATSVIGMAMFLIFLWLSKGVAPAWVQWIGAHFILVIGLIWGGALAIAGWLVMFPRLYAYGALVFVSLIITDSMEGYHLGVSLIAAGGAILLVGVILLVRFLRRYPKQDTQIMEHADD